MINGSSSDSPQTAGSDNSPPNVSVIPTLVSSLDLDVESRSELSTSVGLSVDLVVSASCTSSMEDTLDQVDDKPAPSSSGSDTTKISAASLEQKY